MTARLRDGPPPDAGLDQLAELTAAVPAHAPSKGQRQRVWQAIEVASEHRTRPRAHVVLAIVVMLVTGVVTASAAALVAARWARHAAITVQPGPVAESRPGRAPVRRAHTRLAEPASMPASMPASLPAIVATEGAATRPSTSSPARRPEVRDAASGAPEGAEAALVVEAVQMLRVQRAPARAERLLARYLARHPNGVLAEDARALQLEAAAGDPPRARKLAAAYLSRYPRGRFRASAERALATGEKR